MSRLTFAEIREQGGKLGGNDSVDTWIKTKMNGWFRKHYAHYPWPFLIQQALSVTLTAGSTSILVGAGSNSLTPQVARIFGPVYWRDASIATSRGTANISQKLGQDINQLAAQYDSTITGPPQLIIATPTANAAGLQYMLLNLYPRPDKAYYLTFQYQYLPDDLEDTDTPVYPNELTLIQAAKCAAIEYDSSNKSWFTDESNILASMVAADRDAYGGNQSFGDTLQLDPQVFGGSNNVATKLPWY